MTEKLAMSDDEKEFVITTVSRNDVRELCGDAVANRLTDEDMVRLAQEMAESYVAGSFVEDLREIIEYKFTE